MAQQTEPKWEYRHVRGLVDGAVQGCCIHKCESRDEVKEKGRLSALD